MANELQRCTTSSAHIFQSQALLFIYFFFFAIPPPLSLFSFFFFFADDALVTGHPRLQPLSLSPPHLVSFFRRLPFNPFKSDLRLS